MTEMRSIGVAIPTCNAAQLLVRTLAPVLASPLKPKVLVVDSSSGDDTVKLAQKAGVATIVIAKSAFNHGATREMARHALQTDIAVMLTQDAVLAGPEMLERLVQPIVDGSAAVAYARQVPHEGAGILEAFPRRFNYPARSELRSNADVGRYGAYTFFCSDSCCAWSNAALDAIGGFDTTLSLEDTIAAAKLLRQGYKIAYCADAVVRHSHRYTLKQEFDRFVDTGYVRQRYKEFLFVAGGDEKRGAAYTRALLLELARHEPFSIPYAVASIGAKLLGYRLGYHSRHLPSWLRRGLGGRLRVVDRCEIEAMRQDIRAVAPHDRETA